MLSRGLARKGPWRGGGGMQQAPGANRKIAAAGGTAQGTGLTVEHRKGDRGEGCRGCLCCAPARRRPPS